jgi:hypothetical protein
MACVGAGFSEGETWEWSYPKLNIRACMAEEMRLQDTLIAAQAEWEPAKVHEMLVKSREYLVRLVRGEAAGAGEEEWEDVSSRVGKAREAGIWN